MIPELGRRSITRGNEDYEKELGVILGAQQRRQEEADELEKKLSLYRSGSAPPTVDGSFSAVGGLFSGEGGASSFWGNGFGCEDEEFKEDPEYLSYYYANMKSNPRLPPPMMSREDLRVAQRVKGSSTVLGGILDRRKVNGSGSLFSMPPGYDQMKQEKTNVSSSSEWDANGLNGLDLGGKHKSFADIFQADLGHGNAVTQQLSRLASRNASATQTIGMLQPDSYAAVLGASLSRNGTPDPQAIARVPSPCPTPIGSGRASSNNKRNTSNQSPFNGVMSHLNESSNLATALAGMSLTGSQAEKDVKKVHNYMFGHNGVNEVHKATGYHGNLQLRVSQGSAYNGRGGLPGPY